MGFDWISFATGVIVTAMAVALFREGDEEVVEVGDGVDVDSGVLVNDFKNRHVVMSCQTCRKLKRHREIETGLFQCVRCKRHTDTRPTTG